VDDLATIAEGLFVTVVAVGWFLFLRPDIPSAVRQRIDDALTSEHPERVVDTGDSRRATRGGCQSPRRSCASRTTIESPDTRIRSNAGTAACW
jgi:hypothetical protein